MRLARHLQRPAGVRWSVKLISQNSVEEANRRGWRSGSDVEGLRHSRGNVRPVHNRSKKNPERVPGVGEDINAVDIASLCLLRHLDSQ